MQPTKEKEIFSKGFKEFLLYQRCFLTLKSYQVQAFHHFGDQIHSSRIQNKKQLEDGISIKFSQIKTSKEPSTSIQNPCKQNLYTFNLTLPSSSKNGCINSFI
ncbi:unnamed protein product (macronuclear) [Paramecium tetraurelia]|uniref:Uncharacterized protein n=1 Tax=Paramecium tetraurelia TaxID=5888 RepID=A0BTA1_PARTE|nr:uncharacterized protein GSPATT00032000001 [Paramecium tetraurelia]CAK61768.1 unnamed protein product [Paramecium tetraurelia]|eukprot:XP_001429166.1 hypothetical protein (macronuclear) [Paramecium tetraurelia strain d4-2]